MTQESRELEEWRSWAYRVLTGDYGPLNQQQLMPSDASARDLLEEAYADAEERGADSHDCPTEDLSTLLRVADMLRAIGTGKEKADDRRRALEAIARGLEKLEDQEPGKAEGYFTCQATEMFR